MHRHFFSTADRQRRTAFPQRSRWDKPQFLDDLSQHEAACLDWIGLDWIGLDCRKHHSLPEASRTWTRVSANRVVFHPPPEMAKKRCQDSFWSLTFSRSLTRPPKRVLTPFPSPASDRRPRGERLPDRVREPFPEIECQSARRSGRGTAGTIAGTLQNSPGNSDIGTRKNGQPRPDQRGQVSLIRLGIRKRVPIKEACPL